MIPRFSIALGWTMAICVSALSTSAFAQIEPTLKLDSTGDDVKLLQTRLNKVLSPSPNLTVDGKFNATTKDAVTKFQQAKQLGADGVVGTKTWQSLFDVTVNAEVRLSARGLSILRSILDSAGLTTATVTSGVRTSKDQARVMYDNIKQFGAASQKDLYGPNGDMVIDVYVANEQKPKDEVVNLMDQKIIQLGPSKVSKHCSNTHDVFDVAPSSITDKTKFETALSTAKTEGTISNFLMPPADPAYHIESPK